MPVEVDFWEMDGYPREEIDVGGNFRASRRVLTAWENRYVLRELFRANNGQVYPYITQYQARVRSVGIEPFGLQSPDEWSATMAQYAYAMLSIQYETPKLEASQPNPSDPDNPQLALSETLEPFVDAYRLNPSLFTWSDGDPLKDEEAPVFFMPRINYGLTRFNQNEVPEFCTTYIGTTNNATVQPVLLSETWSFAAGTLLFFPPRIAISADDFGNPQFDLSYVLGYKPEGWRAYYRAETETFSTMKYASSGDPVEFPTEQDFSVLYS